jgi:hypothetical protein
MEKYTLWKNKPETFKCQFNIDGADPAEAVVRLCLEFEDNKNLFFYGQLGEDGNCEIHMPSLKDTKQEHGKLVIEVIADSTYFKVHEAEVELKTSVDIKMENINGFTKSTPKVQVEQVSLKPQPKPKKEEPLKETVESQIDNPYIANGKKKTLKKLKSFNDFKRN